MRALKNKKLTQREINNSILESFTSTLQSTKMREAFNRGWDNDKKRKASLICPKCNMKRTTSGICPMCGERVGD